MFFEVGFAVLLFLFLLAIYGWFTHVADKNYDIVHLEQDIKNLEAALGMAENRIARLNSERVPLRTRCRCGHDAYRHDNNGCKKEGLFFGCSCLASQEQVLYDPEPMRKMLPLGES